MGTSGSDDVLDPGRYAGGVVAHCVLPDPDDLPILGGQQLGDVPVPFGVPLQLPAPPVAVVSRHDAVLGAAVPEATIHEHGDSFGREADVNPLARPPRNPALQPISKTSGVKFRSKAQLGAGVLGSLVPHHP